jgi:mono/diheme cytochrome c family protein
MASLLILSTLAASVCMPTQAEEAAADAAHGRQIYQAFGCWQCHGTTGAGGGWQGPRLAPGPIPLAGVLIQLRTPRGTMPAYPARLLSDRDVADLYAYLLSIPHGRRADEIELLSR